MRFLRIAVCLVTAWAAAGAAQTSQTESKSKIAVKDGKKVLVTGCVEPTASGTGFMLTNVADKSGAWHSYMLVSDDADLSKHLGHRVQIEGIATDRGDGKIETETKTKTKSEHGDAKETRTRSEAKGDLARVPYLGVRSVKMIAAACP